MSPRAADAIKYAFSRRLKSALSTKHNEVGIMFNTRGLVTVNDLSHSWVLVHGTTHVNSLPNFNNIVQSVVELLNIQHIFSAGFLGGEIVTLYLLMEGGLDYSKFSEDIDQL